MPRSSRAQTDEVSAKAQAGNRATVIRDAIKEIQGLEAKRAEIGAAIRSIKQTKIKGDLGMKIGDFNASLRLASLEDESRDEFIDVLKEIFQALGVGGQLDFLDAAEQKPAKTKVVEPEPAKEETYSEQLARTEQPVPGLIKHNEDGTFTDMDTGETVDPFQETDAEEATV